nr:protein msp1 [Quercus suber]
MAAGDRRLGAFVQDLVLFAAPAILAYYLARQLLSRLDPDAGAKAEAQQKAVAASTRLQRIFASHQSQDSDEEDADDDDRRQITYEKRAPKEELVLNQYEQTIAMEVVSPREIPVTFDDIGGLEDIIDELRESVIYPLTMPHLYSQHSSLLTAPSGVLLYGPPGCGKTMLAKALARESGAAFLNLHISTLTEKWYGDSNKLVAAVFSLARKLQPSIVFIDEVDAVLGQRRSGEHEASGMVKAEFMTHWDGLASSTRENGAQRICILGATNRMQDIDEAILRRMPKKFPIRLPNARQRRHILELTLRDTKIDRSDYTNGEPHFDIETLVRLSEGMSGSDLKEACRDAAMVPVREYIKTQKQRGGLGGRAMRGIRGEEVRGLQTDDFFGRKGGQFQNASRGDVDESITTRVRGGDREDRARGNVEELETEGSQHSGSTEEVDDWRDSGEAVGESRF